MYENKYDSHIHSINSHDGREEVSAICGAAVARGLKGIAVTDHCDINSGGKECMRVKQRLLADVRRAREDSGGSLLISAGLELGEAHHNPRLAKELASDPAVDFIIGSLHRMRGEVDFYYMDFDCFSAADLNELLLKYYGELAEMVDCGCFDVIGHINYQARYMSAEARGRLNLEKHYGRLSAILASAAQKQKGIEINTSGLRRGPRETLPSPEVVKMFREVGGEIVTIGSDAHNAGSVGEGVAEGMRKLREAGFDSFAFFRQRKASLIPIA